MLKCDNCATSFEHQNQLKHVFPNIPDLLERLDPGGIVPVGECPHCGALVYPVNPVRLLVVLKSGLVQEVLSDREGAEIAVLDQDSEGADEDEIVDIVSHGDALQGVLQRHETSLDETLVESAYGKL